MARGTLLALVIHILKMKDLVWAKKLFLIRDVNNSGLGKKPNQSMQTQRHDFLGLKNAFHKSHKLRDHPRVRAQIGQESQRTRLLGHRVKPGRKRDWQRLQRGVADGPHGKERNPGAGLRQSGGFHVHPERFGFQKKRLFCSQRFSRIGLRG